jgi:hypothetical protein
MVDLADLSGNGRCGKRRRDQARHVRHQSAGLPGLLIQEPISGGSQARLSLALSEVFAGTGADRHFQSQLLRRDSRCPGSPRVDGKAKDPAVLITKNVWEDRYEDIRNIERYLTRNGVVIRKFFLHVSADEQKKRFLERLDSPAKNWKFSSNDSRERGFWKEYMKAYEDMICNTATDDAPWFVVPADNKWFTRVVVAAAVIDALESLDLRYPEIGEAQRQELAAAKKELTANDKL